MIQKVSELVADFLADRGVTDHFTVTGGGAMHLNDAFGHHTRIHTVYNHNEQGCAIAAESYARVTGRIASVCVTSGPGGTNAITGVMGGWLDSIPMFIVSGQVKRETTLAAVPDLRLRQLGDQEFDIIGSVSNMTKYAHQVRVTEDILYHLEKAWYLANEGRKGPVWLDIPLDVQGAKVETETLRHFIPGEEGYGKPDPCDYRGTAETVLEKLHAAKSPVIFAGYGVRLSGSAELLLEAVRKLRIPVQLAWNSGDLVAYDNPYYAGSPSREGTRGSAFNIQNADCLLVLGSRMNIRTVTYNRHDFAKNAYKIMVDIDPDELEKPTFVPDMKVCGDVKKFLEALLACDYTPNPDHEKWVRFCRDELERYPAVLPEYHRETGKINPYVFLEKLSGQLSDHEVLTLGNASACVMTFAALKIRQGMRMFTNSGCAAMGYGMPASIGAAAALRERNGRVVCIDGDGSLMMNVQELAVIAHNRMNVKLFVIDNAGYHSIRQTQSNLFKGRSFVGIGPDSGVGFPDFRLLAEAFGFAYRLVETEPGAEDVIRDALSLDGPVFIQVKVDETQNFVPKLSSRVLPDGSIVSPSLDDMYPFLSREEYERNRFYLC